MGNRLLALMAVMSVVIVLHLGLGATAQPTEAFQKAMRDTGAAFQMIRAASKDIEDSGAGGQDYAPFETATAALKTAFATTLAFWQAQKVDDAATLAADAARAVAELEAAAKERDYRLVLEASTALGATCTACHAAHRVRLADGTYAIK